MCGTTGQHHEQIVTAWIYFCVGMGYARIDRLARDPYQLRLRGRP